MSRSAAATDAGRTRIARHPAGAPLPRRVSGPAAPPRDDGRAPRAHIDAGALGVDGAVADRHLTSPVRGTRALGSPRPQRLAYGGVAIASRVAGVALDVSASRLMDRVVRGRVWIGLIAFSLIGLVAMQVSMLKLNAGIGRAAQTVSTLERSNSALRSDITSLSAGDRIQPLAEAQGLVMPAPADVRYLRADAHAAARAAQRMRAPAASDLGPAGTATAPAIDTTPPVPGATTPAATPVAPAATAPAPTPPASGPAGAGTGGSAPTSPAAAQGTSGGAAPAPAVGTPPAGEPAPAATASGGASPQQATAPTP